MMMERGMSWQGQRDAVFFDEEPGCPLLGRHAVARTQQMASRKPWFARRGSAAGHAVRSGPALPATARAISGIMQDVTTLRSMLHGTQDSPGVCWSQCALDLGLPVALPGAAGQPG